MPVPFPTISAEAGCVMDARTGLVLGSKSPALKRINGSTTKVPCGAIFALHNPSLDALVPISATAGGIGGSGVDIKAGEVYPAYDLMRVMYLPSDNRAAYALAEYGGRVFFGGGPTITSDAAVQLYLDAMNAWCAGLGCVNTNFTTPSGYKAGGYSGHYTTAYDMCLITRAAFAIPQVLAACSTPTYAATPASGGTTTYLLRHGCKMYGLAQAQGAKVGTVPGSDHCLVTQHALGDRLWVIAVLGSGDDWNDGEGDRLLYEDALALLAFAEQNAAVGGVQAQRGSTNDMGLSGFVPSAFDAFRYVGGVGVECTGTGTASTAWRGTALRMRGPKGPDQGWMRVCVDTQPPFVVDTYSPTLVKDAVLFGVGGLPNGRHLVSVTALGLKSAAATATTIRLDTYESENAVAGPHGVSSTAAVVYDFYLQAAGATTGWQLAVEGAPSRIFDVPNVGPGQYNTFAVARRADGAAASLPTAVFPVSLAATGPAALYNLQDRAVGETAWTVRGVRNPSTVFDFVVPAGPREAQVQATRLDGSDPTPWSLIYAYTAQDAGGATFDLAELVRLIREDRERADGPLAGLVAGQAQAAQQQAQASDALDALGDGVAAVDAKVAAAKAAADASNGKADEIITGLQELNGLDTVTADEIAGAVTPTIQTAVANANLALSPAQLDAIGERASSGVDAAAQAFTDILEQHLADGVPVTGGTGGVPGASDVVAAFRADPVVARALARLGGRFTSSPYPGGPDGGPVTVAWLDPTGATDTVVVVDTVTLDAAGRPVASTTPTPPAPPAPATPAAQLVAALKADPAFAAALARNGGRFVTTYPDAGSAGTVTTQWLDPSGATSAVVVSDVTPVDESGRAVGTT